MNNKFNWQSFISIALLFSFLVMMFSGIVLYIAPEGSLSRWIGWEVFGLTKSQWEQQHTIFSYLFVVFTVLHIFKINWAWLWSYFFVKKMRFVFYKEILVALAITVIFFTGTLTNINPFRWVSDAGETISKSFNKGVERPDISNPEKMTIEQFAQEVFNLSYAEFLEVAKIHQLEINRKEQTVQDFCSDNNISPVELHEILKKKNVGLDRLD
ncbi:MAG: DUF4405 domain-containing protein [Bacteroidota bacterium]|nr:DUF4405 domain-containing protein [Bacteroidota bacterium]